MSPFVTLSLAALALLMLPPQALADVVVPDDQIVQGSTCIGLDCVNNESFSFDTLRLKENNVQINFDDTSSSPGFAANDWRLIANESASGGRNMFSLEDSTGGKVPFALLAGAPTNSLFVAADGSVGLGTATPTATLDVVGDARASGAVLQGADPADAADVEAVNGAALLAALRTLPLTSQRYTADGANLRHLWPSAHDFNAAFALGDDDGAIAPGDMAGVALAAVKALDARVSAAPAGPKGDSGPAGAKGDAGPAGTAGPAGPAAGSAAILKRLTALEKTNKALTKRVKTLERKLAKQKKATSKKRR